MFLLYRIIDRIIFRGKEQIAPGELGGNGATTMHLSYSDLFLAFLGLDRGAPNVLTMAPTFDLQVSTGDTVVVRARKQALADADAFISFDQDPEIQLSAEFSVGGIGVVTNGSSGSATDDRAGFSFSYTVP